MKKDQTVETLRGAVILLVVIGHVIGSGSDGGMKVSDDSFFRYFYDTFIDPIQMPLFTILAGWVYSLRPPVYGSVKKFISKKVSRLLIPMLVVGACYFLLQYFTPGTNNKGELTAIWKLVFFPYTLFWYLYSLFIVFIIVALIDAFNKMNSITNWILIFCISVLALLLRDVFIPFEVPNYLSYKGTLYLLPSFILGVGLNRFKEVFQSKKVLYASIILLVGCVIIQQLSWFKVIDYVVHKDNIVGLTIGFTATMVLLSSKIEINWLVWVGGFAYSIYLFHAFGTAGGRILPQKLHSVNIRNVTNSRYFATHFS
ncbi:acyltransferase-like protein [Mariniflexile fucanivorans]|uniref:Acyltransferase-like protein n=1 Tax=Mariniflexile fucanivorans TaxID=264023 RepID=A0A4R1RP19_9FLAO|nr:acyltransferase [Mariniflexile fucanivorans]TCL67929.1 acyltransferase-like protein [Mariniflexile fucanivorans]